jgi:hypothetical protein
MQDTHKIEIHELLAERKQIAAVWSIEDVQEVRPELNDDQAWDVLRDVDRHKDAELGINWMTIKYSADDLYPKTEDVGKPASE